LRNVAVPIPARHSNDHAASENRYKSITRALNPGANLLGPVTLSSDLGQSDQDREQKRAGPQLRWGDFEVHFGRIARESLVASVQSELPRCQAMMGLG
jgi:hypothetical protein